VRCVSKDEVGTHGPPSWFETARALNIKHRTSASGARLLTMRADYARAIQPRTSREAGH